jgi:uncharacterized membrane protein
MEHQIKQIFQDIAIVLEVFGGIVIIISAAYCAFLYVSRIWKSIVDPMSTDDIRLKLAKALSFSLEFLVAADILKTIITPTLHEISILGATIAIRVVLNFFLQREMSQMAPNTAATS